MNSVKMKKSNKTERWLEKTRTDQRKTKNMKENFLFGLNLKIDVRGNWNSKFQKKIIKRYSCPLSKQTKISLNGKRQISSGKW